MSKLNVVRVVLGGIVAGVLLFIGDGIVHGVLLQQRWDQVMAALGRSNADHSTGFHYFAAYDLLKGIAIVWLYAAIRPRFGAGPPTAILAGLAVWFLVIPVPLLGLLPMHFLGRRMSLVWSVYGAIPMVVAALVGAWIYREDGAPTASKPSG